MSERHHARFGRAVVGVSVAIAGAGLLPMSTAAATARDAGAATPGATVAATVVDGNSEPGCSVR